MLVEHGARAWSTPADLPARCSDRREDRGGRDLRLRRRSVAFTGRARHDLARIDRLGLGGLPVCIAKVPGSLSDDPKRRGRPRDFEITVRELRIAAGAGFVVALTGEILRMPGLPRAPRAASIDVRDGRIEGLG
ncbi:MAG: formate--tetrahydrofolate ligase [Myxococcota bacterium]